MAGGENGNGVRRHDGVKVISRAAEMLRALADSREGLSLAELARQVGLPRSTVYRIAAALAAEGFVFMTGSQRGVRLGPELAQLALRARGSLQEVARPHMEKLAGAVNETVDLAVLRDGRVRFIDQVAGTQRLRAEAVVGEVYPAHCTANGKALLATLSEQALRALLQDNRLQRFTPHTTVSQAKLLAELEEVRATGIAFDREEHTLQICAVGAVIRDAFGETAALTVAAPSHRFYGREKRLATALMAATRRVNAALRVPSS
jgi:DNA-binding IclR family transcriptional regulator